jgi:alpha-tubulin suppressor-like RCC1 family protein/signal transduction histidine kinase
MYKRKMQSPAAAVFLFVLSIFAVTIFVDPVEALAAPVVTSASPSSVSVTGGDAVTVIGTGFEATSTVEINGVTTATNYVDAQTLTFTTVTSVAGAKRVTVVNADGQRFNLASGLTFLDVAPTLTSINPDEGAIVGGQSITLSGAGFTTGLKQVTQIGTGDQHSCGVYDGKAYCWGLNSSGQLGTGNTTTSFVPVPVSTTGVLNGKTIKSLAVGSTHTCAITTDGMMACWGGNNYGQLGNNATSAGATSSPVNVTLSGALIGKTFESVAIGGFKTCAVASDGLAYCTGRNNVGQLGTGNLTDARVLTAVSTSGVLNGLTIKQISANTNDACAIASDNRAYCWGNNSSGQAGNNTITASNVPVAVDTSTLLNGVNLVSIASGLAHTCAISADGIGYCWGIASYLGDGTATASRVPVAVDTSDALLNKKLLSIQAGSNTTCAVASDNHAYCWGIGSSGQLGNNSTLIARSPVAVISNTGALAGLSILSVATALNHTCAIASDNQTYCWGNNTSGVLGNNSGANSLVPVASTGVIKAIPVLTIGTNAATNVQITQPSTLTATSPVGTSGLKNVTLTQYDGQSATLENSYRYFSPPANLSVAPSTGSIVGGDTITVTGTGFSEGVKVKIRDTYVNSVTRINDTTLTFVTPATSSAGAVDVVVEDLYGQSSTLTAGFTYQNPAMTISSLNPTGGPTSGGQTVTFTGTNFFAGFRQLSQITTGWQHSCGIYEQQAYCWGLNTNGQLGTGSNAPSSVPQAVSTTGVLAGKTIKSISAGADHTCALASDNQVYCWGVNTNGQLGNNLTANSSSPVAVSMSGLLAGKTVNSIDSSYRHSCLVASDNQAYCWGLNNNGQLGNNTITSSSVPTPVSTTGVFAGKTIKSIASTMYHTCAIASDNQAYCWGQNASGKLGTGNGTDSRVPVAVLNTGVLAGKTIKTIEPAYSHTCALSTDNLAYCWGQNINGALGNGLNTDSSSPVAVTTTGNLAGKTISSLNSGDWHSCVITTEGKGYCWGLNDDGQLGTGNTTKSNVALPIDMTGALAGKTFTSISGAYYHTCAQSSDNQGYCWGTNTNGKLGNNSTISSLIPVAVSNISLPKAMTVSFGGTLATNVQIISQTQMTAITPAHAAGVIDVVATSYDDQVVTKSNAYTFAAPPTATSIAPNTGQIAGGDTVTMTGSNFAGTLKVKVGDTYSSLVTVNSSTSLTFVVPASVKPGQVSVVVEDEFGAFSTLSNAYTYRLPDPILNSVSPISGRMGGGTSITISGSNFIANPDGGTWYQVRVGGTLATNVTYVNSTTLTAQTPSGAIGTTSVSVESVHSSTVTLANSFTYVAQSYVFSNTALNLSTNEAGMLTVQARNNLGNPVTSPTATVVTLASSSTGGSFARNLTEDMSTRWSYTTVTIPAGQSSVNVYYKDTVNGTPIITGTVDGAPSFTQSATISSPFRFVVTGVSDPIKAGVPSSFTVRVTDKNGNQRTDYTGTIVFSSTDSAATLPSNYTMKTTDYGIKTFTNGVTMGSVGEFCLTAADSVDGALVRGQQCGITVQPANVGTISKLAIITPEQRVTAGRFSSPITIQTQDTSNVSIPVASDKQIYLYSPSATGEFSDDGITWSGVMPFETTITAGSTSKNVYFRDSTAHTTTIKASDNSSESTGGNIGWSNAEQSITTGLSPPTKMRVTGLQAMISGQKSDYLVELMDDAGNIVSTDSDITIRVDADTPTSRFYYPSTEAIGTVGPTEFIIPSGMTGTTIAFSDTTLSTSSDFTTLTFVDGRPQTETARLQDGTKEVQIVTAFPTKINLTAQLDSIEAGDSTAVDVQLMDDNNQVAPAIETTIIGLSSSTGSGEYSLTQTPFTPVTSVTIPQGESLKRVYFRDTLAGTSTLTASRTGMTADADEVEITSSATARFGITPLTMSAPVDTSSDAFTVTSYDVFGNIVIQDTALNVYPYSDQATTQFSAASTGPWSQNPVTILNGQSSVQFYAKDTTFYASPLQITASDKATLDSPDVDIANATTALTITSQSVVSVAITSTQQTVVAGAVSNRIDVELRKTDGTPAIQNGSTSITLAVSNGKFIATNNAAATGITSIAIAEGSATASFYYYGEKSGLQTISATLGGTNVTTTQPLTVQSAVPTKLIYTSPVQSIEPNTPSAAYNVVIRDQFDNDTSFSTDKTLNISSNCTTGSFSVSNSNWQNITSINIAAGTTTASFYYKDSEPSNCALTVAISGITSATQQVSVKSYAVETIAFTTPQRTIKAGEKSGIITVELRKTDGTPAYQDGSTQIQLQVPSGQFFLNVGDTQTVSSVAIAAGQASASFYYSGTLAGSRDISVSLAGVTLPATQQVTITPEAPSQLAFTTQPQTVAEGSPSSPIHVAIRDTYGNTSALTGDTTLNLTSNCVTGTFSEDNIDWQPVASIELVSGSTDATFYYRAMIQGNCTMTVSATGLQTATQLTTITDSNFPVRVGLTVPSETLIKGENRSISVTLLDQNGDISPAKVRTTVYLTTSSDGEFNISTIIFNPGSSTRSVTYKNNEAGQVTLYARDQVGETDEIGSLIDTSASLTYTEGAAASVKIQAATTAQVGASTVVTTTLLNDYGLAVSATSDTIVNFSSNLPSGLFYDSNGNAVSQVTIPAGQSQVTIDYRQSQPGTATIRAQSTGLVQSTTPINVLSPNTIAEIRFIVAPQTIDVGVSTLYRVGLYDEFGNVVTTPGDLTLYASSNATSEVSGSGEFTILAGQSNASFTYKQNAVGPFTITVSDSLNGANGAIDPLIHTGEAIAGDPKSFRFVPTNVLLERGGVTDAITIELLNADNQPTAATGNGQVVNLGVNNGQGKYSTNRNGAFNSQLSLNIPAGQTSAVFYYRNDTNVAGTYSLPGRGTFAGTNLLRNGSVTLRYGEPTQLVLITQPITVEANSPSKVLTVQQQNQYGMAVPVTSNRTIYLTSDAATGQFADSKVNWGVNSVTMRSGDSTVDFYYEDTETGQRLITASDTLPLEPDVVLKNATQQLSVTPSSNVPRIISNFLVTNISDPQAQGTMSSLVLIARDADGYIVENYAGTVTFTSDDLDAQLPQSYTFIPSVDKGVKVFTNQVAFSSEGEKSVTATDSNGITGTQTDITVGEGNTNAVRNLVITQPESPVTIAPNTPSPNITVELRDVLGNATNAPAGGMPIRVTSTTATGQFATSTAGPWQSSLTVTVAEGFGYTNLFYRDSAVGNATITASDWVSAIDNSSITNATLEVIVHRTYVAGERSIQTLNALGEYETSAQLFARNSTGSITGKVSNNFSSRNMVNDQLVAVEWRTQWRQGVNLLKTDTASNQTNFSVTIDPIETTAGASDFYAVAETTETTFADTFSVVSKQLQTMVSPWRTAITTQPYAIQAEDITGTLTFRSGSTLANPAITNIFVLEENDTNSANAIYTTGVASPGSTYQYSIPAGIAALGGSYKILAVTYDANGNTTSQAVSNAFTVLETPPAGEVPPVIPTAPLNPSTPKPSPTPPTTPINTAPEPSAPTVPSPLPTAPVTSPSPNGSSTPVVEGASNNDQLVTASIVATYGATLFVGVFLARESYKEWARIRRIRSILKREQQLAVDKDTFLSLASHYLRTPITILDAAVSMVSSAAGLQFVAASLRKKADALLEGGAATSLKDIESPDIKKITRSAFLSVYFWLPIIVSIALTVAVTVLFNVAAAGVDLNDTLVYVSIVLVALALIVGFGARTVFINQEVENAQKVMNLHHSQLFTAKTQFILATQQDIANEIAQLKNALATSNLIPDNVKGLIQDGTKRLEALVSKLSIIANINGISAQVEDFTPQALVQPNLQRQQPAIEAKQLTINEDYQDTTTVAQDQRMLRYVTGTVIDNAVMFSEPGSTIDIKTSKQGKTTQVSVINENSTFGSADKLTAIFEPFNHATHENDLTVDGIGLSLYVDKLIMEHLGGTISASNSTLGHSAAINISFPSSK